MIPKIEREKIIKKEKPSTGREKNAEN